MSSMILLITMLQRTAYWLNIVEFLESQIRHMIEIKNSEHKAQMMLWRNHLTSSNL
jgi:hypothetical protein